MELWETERFPSRYFRGKLRRLIENHVEGFGCGPSGKVKRLWRGRAQRVFRTAKATGASPADGTTGLLHGGRSGAQIPEVARRGNQHPRRWGRILCGWRCRFAIITNIGANIRANIRANILANNLGVGWLWRLFHVKPPDTFENVRRLNCGWAYLREWIRITLWCSARRAPEQRRHNGDWRHHSTAAGLA